MNKLPPQHLDAERGVLSACITNAHDHAEVRDTLAAEDFYHDAHQTIFRTLGAMRDSGKPVDYVTLAGELQAMSELENVGGVSYLSELINFGNHAHLAHYVRLVLEASAARTVVRACNEAIRDALDGVGPIAETLEVVQTELTAAAGKLVGDTDSSTIGDVVNEVLDQIDRRDRGERPAVTPTGFAELDDLLCGGLQHGHLIVLAARTSVGKTAFAVNVTRQVCDRGEGVLFCTLEQAPEELTSRLIANVSGVAGTIISRGKPNASEVQRISEAADRVRGWPLEIRDVTGRTAQQIAAIARLAKRKQHRLGLIVVDYLNEVRPDAPSGKRAPMRVEELGATCRRLRECARMLNVPLLLLAQLNRAAADEKEVPKLHHLRESGQIEQISDEVIMLHREERGDGHQRAEQIRLYVAKQRNGPQGSVPYFHETPCYRFREAGFE